MEIEKNDISSLLYNSLKDVLYNKDCIYVYCNFKIEDMDNILKEMLDTKILDKDGYKKYIDSNTNSIANFKFNLEAS